MKQNKVLIYGIIALAIGVVGYFSLRFAKRFVTKKNEASTIPDANTSNVPLTVTLDTTGRTLSNGDASIIAQNLFDAMEGWGTNEEALIANLNKCKTKGDLNLIIQTFGMRQGQGLIEWIYDDLGGSSLAEAKAIFDKLNVPF